MLWFDEKLCYIIIFFYININININKLGNKWEKIVFKFYKEYNLIVRK